MQQMMNNEVIGQQIEHNDGYVRNNFIDYLPVLKALLENQNFQEHDYDRERRCLFLAVDCQQEKDQGKVPVFPLLQLAKQDVAMQSKEVTAGAQEGRIGSAPQNSVRTNPAGYENSCGKKCQLMICKQPIKQTVQKNGIKQIEAETEKAVTERVEMEQGV
jgi:hypothetical protein